VQHGHELARRRRQHRVTVADDRDRPPDLPAAQPDDPEEAGAQLSGHGELAAAWRAIAPGNRQLHRLPVRQREVMIGRDAGCQIFAEAVRRAGSTESDTLRDAVLALRTKTILGDFAVDDCGFQVGQKAVTIQWQDGKKVVVWPGQVASGKLLPTPPWNLR
jgi:hypothetical protein